MRGYIGHHAAVFEDDFKGAVENDHEEALACYRLACGWL